MLASLSSTSIRWKPVFFVYPIQATMMNSWWITFKHGKAEVPNQFSAILSCCLVRHHNTSLVVILKCARSPKSCCIDQSISWGCSLIQDASRSWNIWKIATWTFTFWWFYSIRWVYSTPTSFLLPLVYGSVSPQLFSPGQRSAPLCRPLKSTRKTLGFTPRVLNYSERKNR